jgi:hypothetical protein
MKFRVKLPFKTLFACALVCASNIAAALSVTSAFEGNWYDPNISGQGFIFERYEDAQGRKGLNVSFFTYDDNARALFFTAGGLLVKGNKQIFPIFRPRIGQEISPGVYSPPTFTEVGRMELTFSSCNAINAKTSFNPNALSSTTVPGVVPSKIRVGTGSFGLRRLVALNQSKRCTGGISDDTVPNESPKLLDKTVQINDFEVRTRYEVRPDASDLRLIFKYLPPGEYALFADDEELQRFVMTGNFPFTIGEVRFRSPQLASISSLLDFDPIGKQFTFRGAQPSNLGIQRSFQLPTENLQPLQPIPNFGFAPAPVPVIVRETSVAFTETVFARGITPESFKFRARLESTPTGAELRLAVDGLPIGSYQVFFNGLAKGTIRSANDGFGDFVSETIFRSPTTAGSFPLDFSPLGATARIVGANGVDIEVQLDDL